ncbi:protein quaking-A-like isoform X2 [Lineus longissimus]|uniref:protein quaking-A-like isoform X2 n=1 Tax=Lineus longissimus TaxID=88925 RepID=UPI00315D94A5
MELPQIPSIPAMMGTDSKPPSVGLPSHSSHNQQGPGVPNIQHVLHTMPQFLQQTHQTQEHEVTPDYLQQLLKDKKLLQDLQPNLTQPFTHMDRLLEDEIFRVRLRLFHICLANMVEAVDLPEPAGPVCTLSDKVYIPVKEFPDFNFVGRLLGPRGTTAKFLEHVLNAKIMVRGRGSMRDKRLEEQYRGKTHWEHLQDDLHVLLTVEDTHNRSEILLRRAAKAIRKFLEVIPEGQDELKKRQLMELAILNGTYRDTSKPSPGSQQVNVTQSHLPGMPGMLPLHLLTDMMSQGMNKPTNGQDEQTNQLRGSPHGNHRSDAPRVFPPQLAVPQMRSPPTPAGAPVFFAQPPTRLPTGVPTTGAGLLNHHAPTAMMSPTEAAMIYPYTPEYHQYAHALTAAAPTALYDFHGAAVDQSAAEAAFYSREMGHFHGQSILNSAHAAKVRKQVLGVREHPYQRVTLP